MDTKNNLSRLGVAVGRNTVRRLKASLGGEWAENAPAVLDGLIP